MAILPSLSELSMTLLRPDRSVTVAQTCTLESLGTGDDDGLLVILVIEGPVVSRGTVVVVEVAGTVVVVVVVTGTVVVVVVVAGTVVVVVVVVVVGGTVVVVVVVAGVVVVVTVTVVVVTGVVVVAGVVVVTPAGIVVVDAIMGEDMFLGTTNVSRVYRR